MSSDQAAYEITYMNISLADAAVSLVFYWIDVIKCHHRNRTLFPEISAVAKGIQVSLSAVDYCHLT